MGSLTEEAEKRLASHGGRMTTQRRLILETLETMSSHPTADELYSVLRRSSPGLNLSTVYRNLRWLELEGLISSRLFKESRSQERFDPALPFEHHHFFCTACKRVIEFNDPCAEDIKSAFESQSGALVERATVTLYGLCRSCQLESVDQAG